MRELKTRQHRQVSSTSPAASQSDLADEREKQFHERAALAAERYPRYAKAFDQLCAATLGTESLQSLLQKLIEILVEASHAAAAVLRLREGARLNSRAALGLEEGVAAVFSIAAAKQSVGPGGKDGDVWPFSPPPLDGVVISEAIRSKGMRR